MSFSSLSALIQEAYTYTHSDEGVKDRDEIVTSLESDMLVMQSIILVFDGITTLLAEAACRRIRETIVYA